MTAARSILCASLWTAVSACAASAAAQAAPEPEPVPEPSAAHDRTLGGATLDPGEAVVYAAGGWDVTFPTVSLGASAGVVPGLDLDVRYDTRAGLAHDFGVRARGGFADAWAASLAVSHGFFAVEELGGIQASRAPFGNGLAITPALHVSTGGDDGPHVAFALGATIRMTRLRESFGALSRELDPSLESAWLEAAVEWDDDGASTFLSFRATVPIQADLRVLGYLPWIAIGRSWELH